MKKILLIIAGIVVFMLLTPSQQSQALAQTTETGIEVDYFDIVHCRCHSDGSCRSGYAVSTRPCCGKLTSEFCYLFAQNCPYN